MPITRDEAVRLPKKAEVVARRIASMIVDRELEPGTLLPNEPEMLAQFQVARSTLREALRLLETQGVLSLQAGRSPIVRRPTADELVNSLTLLLQFQGGTFETLLTARVLFEPAIAAEAAQRATPEALERLRRNLEEAKTDSSAALTARVQCELDFHRLVGVASGNPLAIVMVATLTSILNNEFIDHPVDHDFESEIQVHEEIVAAIEAKDAARSAQLMRAHVEQLAATALSDHPSLMRRPIRWI